MKKGELPGEGGIVIVFIKEGGDRQKEPVLKFFNRCCREGDVPKKWKRKTYFQFIKGRRYWCLCNHREISLTDHLGKSYENTLEKRLRELI